MSKPLQLKWPRSSRLVPELRILMSRKLWLTSCFATFICCIFLWESNRFQSSKSLTFDETYYLNCGLQSVYDGRLDARIAGQGVAPLPILLNYVLPFSLTEGANRTEPWEGSPGDRDRIVGPRRLNAILFGVPLVLLVFVWLYCRRGLPAAITGASLIAFSPTLLANASLATADCCFAFFGTLGVAATAWYFHKPNRLRFLFWATSIAAAMSAKYSGVFLLPLAGLLLFFNFENDQDVSPGLMTRFKSSVKQFLIFLGLVVPIWWAFHLFSFTGPLKNVPLAETPDSSPWVQILGRGDWADRVMEFSHSTLKRPAPVAGVVFQYLHNKSGHGSFLLGQRNQTGWWYYFPCAFAFKSTPAELVLSVFLIVLLLIGCRAPRTAWQNLDGDLQAIYLGAAIFGLMVLTANINIGQRYLIGLYPLLVIAGVDRLFTLREQKPKAVLCIAGLLVAGQIASCLQVSPHYLAYFNRASGGPENGCQLLIDSNIDWGQDLPALKESLAESDHAETALCYFGTALPSDYGVGCESTDNLSWPAESYRRLAISASCLQGFYVPGDDPFAAFRRYEPDARAGYSILIYELDTLEKQKAFTAGIEKIESAIALRKEAKQLQ